MCCLFDEKNLVQQTEKSSKTSRPTPHNGVQLDGLSQLNPHVQLFRSSTTYYQLGCWLLFSFFFCGGEKLKIKIVVSLMTSWSCEFDSSAWEILQPTHTQWASFNSSSETIETGKWEDVMIKQLRNFELEWIQWENLRSSATLAFGWHSRRREEEEFYFLLSDCFDSPSPIVDDFFTCSTCRSLEFTRSKEEI